MTRPYQRQSKETEPGAVNLCEILCNTVITTIYKELSRKLSYLVSTALIKLFLITKRRETKKIAVDEPVCEQPSRVSTNTNYHQTFLKWCHITVVEVTKLSLVIKRRNN